MVVFYMLVFYLNDGELINIILTRSLDNFRLRSTVQVQQYRSKNALKIGNNEQISSTPRRRFSLICGAVLA